LIALIKSDLRKEDYIGRLGGEEFVIVMPVTDCDEAFDIGERLRNRVMNTVFLVAGGDIKLTISTGIAELRRRDRGIEDMLARADAALYAAKSGGRNRSVRQDGIPLTAA
jgi:diguanylate cyclase (GGDEF)-like protein